MYYIRYWWNKFGILFAKDLKKKAAHCYSHWRWHIDEVFVKITGKTYYFWRAIDHEGAVLDCFVSKKQDRKSALKVLKRLVSRYGQPKKIVTDRLPSYKAALRDLSLEHLQEKERYKNNQVENSHLHFRRRERGMNKFRSMRSLQKFINIQSTFQNHFNYQRHLEKRETFKNLRQNSVNSWQEIFT